jgi:hypothetical protein
MIGSGRGAPPRGVPPIAAKRAIPPPCATVRATHEAEPVVTIGVALDIASNLPRTRISCTRAPASTSHRVSDRLPFCPMVT